MIKAEPLSTKGKLHTSINGIGESVDVFLYSPQATENTPLYIILGHELIHADGAMNGTWNQDYRSDYILAGGVYWKDLYTIREEELATTGLQEWDFEDEWTMGWALEQKRLIGFDRWPRRPSAEDYAHGNWITENMLRKENGLVKRESYKTLP